jgi:hypothetical protein
MTTPLIEAADGAGAESAADIPNSPKENWLHSHFHVCFRWTHFQISRENRVHGCRTYSFKTVLLTAGAGGKRGFGCIIGLKMGDGNPVLWKKLAGYSLYQAVTSASFFLKNFIASSTSDMSTQVFTQGPFGRSLMTP